LGPDDFVPRGRIEVQPPDDRRRKAVDVESIQVLSITEEQGGLGCAKQPLLLLRA
jgi:hypothetical protein